jgi:hypothetical protein
MTKRTRGFLAASSCLLLLGSAVSAGAEGTLLRSFRAGARSLPPQAAQAAVCKLQPQVHADPLSGTVISLAPAADGSVQVTGFSGDLQFRKTVHADGRSRLELGYLDELVTVEAAPGAIRVSAAGRAVRFDPSRGEGIHISEAKRLLNSSRAVRLFRSMVSDLAPATLATSAGTSLHISDIFVAMLEGDLAPRKRVAPRVGKNEMTIMEEGCYAAWKTEVVAAMDDYIDCLDSFSSYNPMRLACAGEWILRAEVAWFEMLACIAIPF